MERPEHLPVIYGCCEEVLQDMDSLGDLFIALIHYMEEHLMGALEDLTEVAGRLERDEKATADLVAVLHDKLAQMDATIADLKANGVDASAIETQVAALKQTATTLEALAPPAPTEPAQTTEPTPTEPVTATEQPPADTSGGNAGQGDPAATPTQP